ncbi:MAG: DUF3179 domain-containing protein [Myxococcales bacterium]|nr:MAG: DUF3179 domain-containing protein [Myxococcales bacterium]
MSKDAQPVPIAVKVAFWFCIIVGSLGSFFIWKDLADISQWMVTSPREHTMAVWYHRWEITMVSFAAMGVALWLWVKNRSLLNKYVFIAIGLLAFFNWYAGFINPGLMMRSRQHDGVILSVEQARPHVEPDESVIVVDINGHARAHPDFQVLRPHVAGNDDKPIGGENVIMTYCGLTNLGMAYTPEIDGEPVDLHPRTQLENNLVMVDSISGEPIQQIWGAKEVDVVAGNPARMREWPTFRMPFAKFEEAYPDGEVFINDYVAKGYMTTWIRPVKRLYDDFADFLFSIAITTQQELERPTFPTIKNIDKRLPAKTLVWGVDVGDDYVAYTEEFVRSQGEPINTQIGGRDVVVTYDEEYESLGIFFNDTGEVVEEIDFFGNVGDTKLERVNTVKAGAYWVIWANWFPDAEINRT